MASPLQININYINNLAEKIITDQATEFNRLLDSIITTDQKEFFFNGESGIFFSQLELRPKDNATIIDSLVFYKAKKIFNSNFKVIQNTFNHFHYINSKEHCFYYIIHNKDYQDNQNPNIDIELTESVLDLYENNLKLFLDSLLFEQHLISLYELGSEKIQNAIAELIPTLPHLSINQAIVSKSTKMLDLVSNFLTDQNFRSFMSTTSPQLTLFHYAALTLDVDVFMWCFQKVLFLKNEDGSISNTEDTDKYVLEFFESKKDFLMYCIKNSKDNPTEFVYQLLSNETFRSYSGYKGLILHRDKNNNNLLHYACMRGNAELFNMISSEFLNIINEASEGKMIEGTDIPITLGLLSLKNKDGECPIHLAVKSKSMEILQMAINFNDLFGASNQCDLFENDVVGVYQIDGKKQTILHLAVKAGWIEGVIEILKLEINIAQHFDIESEISAITKIPDIAKVLDIEDKAIKVRLTDGKLSIHKIEEDVSIYCTAIEEKKYFFTKRKDQYGLSPIAWMAINGNLEMLQIVHDSFEEDILYADKSMYTKRRLLHWAVIENQDAIVDYLLENTGFHTQIDILSGEPPFSALHYAVKLENFHMMQTLIHNGSEPNRTNKQFKVKSPFEITEDDLLRDTMNNELEQRRYRENQ
ncbi:hypothetical protein TVAG_395650 [Trichomonas vaginalis G3]|uniref:Uncharacterized protein n=1 Tax=Trichomonas vaginalis (strain ATCC PRA-98 / G3) TaxID=412133 RepID=A2FX41_TRIV3|nr:Ankyrin repeat family [Trichomonas vaginalis G3]EAX90519.1 hypothetical protein TVAG_395650 [Trichomonas vaginalis G3]KAI5483769.1 Ankyrin repeat family [Trichomonas vaginalis G3]|eukprot:XP_001303449.1 hypothetical protein [Trichomonas vaginalis G3]